MANHRSLSAGCGIFFNRFETIEEDVKVTDTKTNQIDSIARRTTLKRLLGYSLAGLAAPVLLRSSPALAADKCQQGTTPKAAMMYQDKPHGKQQCSGCGHFCAGANAKAAGSCNVVKGQISPQGWCVAFTPKS